MKQILFVLLALMGSSETSFAMSPNRNAGDSSGSSSPDVIRLQRENQDLKSQVKVLIRGTYDLFQENLKLKQKVIQLEADLNKLKPGAVISGVVSGGDYMLAQPYACLHQNSAGECIPPPNMLYASIRISVTVNSCTNPPPGTACNMSAMIREKTINIGYGVSAQVKSCVDSIISRLKAETFTYAKFSGQTVSEDGFTLSDITSCEF